MTGIDLRPIAANRAATEVILLARGQLNRAFRERGLFPPDPLPAGPMSSPLARPLHDAAATDPDDPLRFGVEHARAAYGAAFQDWSATLPAKLVSPVLAILGQTLRALQSADPADPDALAAVEEACDFLLEQAHKPRQA